MFRIRSRLKVYLGLPPRASIPSALLGESSILSARIFTEERSLSPFIPKRFIADPSNVGLHFSINGAVKQSGLTSDMIFDIPQLIAFVSSIMKLEEGDLVLTGTPKGVGQIKGGETFEAKLTYPGLDGEVLSKYEMECVDRQGGYEFMP